MSDCYGYQTTEMEENLSGELFSSILQSTGYEGQQKVRDDFIPLYLLVLSDDSLPVSKEKEQIHLLQQYAVARM